MGVGDVEDHRVELVQDDTSIATVSRDSSRGRRSRPSAAVTERSAADSMLSVWVRVTHPIIVGIAHDSGVKEEHLLNMCHRCPLFL